MNAYLLLGLSFSYEISSDFDSRFKEGLGHFGDGEAKEMSYFLSDRVVR